MTAAPVRASYYSETRYEVDPFTYQVGQQLELLKSSSAENRAAALENLSAMRAYGFAAEAIRALKDDAVDVRREAAMNLGWTGDRSAMQPLLAAMSDENWSVAQAASVSLDNLTALQLEFDALGTENERSAQLQVWSEAIETFEDEQLLSGLAACAPDDFFKKAKYFRAIGLLRMKSADEALAALMRPYIARSFDLNGKESTMEMHRGEKLYVQAGLRALGLLNTEVSKAMLLNVMKGNPQWAVYAVDALGDIGGEDVAAAILKEYPSYSTPRTGQGYVWHNKRVPYPDFSKFPGNDRIYRIPFAMLNTLARIHFESEENMAALRSVAHLIPGNLPIDFDSTLIYYEEPMQMLTGYLLEKAGTRALAVDAAFAALGMREVSDELKQHEGYLKVGRRFIKRKDDSKYSPYAGTVLMACCRDSKDVPLLIELLESERSGWLKIHAAKALMFADAKEAVPELHRLLVELPNDASYGSEVSFAHFINSTAIKGQGQAGKYGKDYPERFQKFFMTEKKLKGEGYDEFNDPAPRFKEAFIMALGALDATNSTDLIVGYLNNDKNAIEIQYAAAKALYQLATPKALEALRVAEAHHPLASVQQVAREAVWHHDLKKEAAAEAKMEILEQQPVPEGLPEEFVFIKGPFDAGNHEQIPSDNMAYTTTDAGPTYRLGSNVYRVRADDPDGSLRQLTFFETGFVADLEVSYDGKRILFAHRGPQEDPWWHVYEMTAEGDDLCQLTFGPYHDVQPNYMPDGRIVFSSSRLGMRDEYHGYLGTGLTVMNADGTDIHVIGFNIGRDTEPVVGDDGKILFSRLEVFYSRMKTEWNLLSVFPDGSSPNTLYGPERRAEHQKHRGAMGQSPPRHRVLCLTQPQSWSGGRFLINTFAGPIIAGPGPLKERYLLKSHDWAVTTPYRIDDQTLLVAAGERPWKMVEKDGEEVKKVEDLVAVDHGLYYMDIDSGKLTLIYNDPDFADFEARPLQARKIPIQLPEAPFTRTRDFSGKIFCNSIFNTRHDQVRDHGKYVRVVEGVPTIARHQTHNNNGIAWRNHGGAIGRDLGTVSVAADGSFAIEVPSDRMFHLQVLDCDRNVLGNELIWQYARPGENKSCVGCHEAAGSAPVPAPSFAKAHRQAPQRCLPNEHDAFHRAKLWFKGWTSDEREERMHSVNSINLMGRH